MTTRVATDTGISGLAFFGGGSGGHVFPGVAVAECARRRFPDCRVVFYSPCRPVERAIFRDAPFEVQELDIRPPGRSGAGWLRYSLAVARATRRARGLLREGFDVVIGLGGYASVPGVLAARSERRPVILLEQNRVAGKVTRLLAPLATAVSSSYPGMRLRLSKRIEVTGNPVREAVAGLGRAPSECVRHDLRRTVVVVGGSQGASAINRSVTAAFDELRQWWTRIRIIHIAGSGERDLVAKKYAGGGWNATVLGFAPDLPRILSESDLVITRAGGTTLSELSVLGLPAVLIPFPHHRDRHQFANAQAFVEAGAGVLIEEEDVNAETLGDVVGNILFVRGRLGSMARCARRLARPDAAESVLNLAIELSESCREASACSC